MISWRIPLFLMATLAPGSFAAQVPSAESNAMQAAQPDLIDAFMRPYYVHPRPQAIGEFIVQLHGLGEKRLVNGMPALIGFFSEVFAANPERVAIWQASVSAEDKPLTWAVRRAAEVNRTGGVLAMGPPSPQLQDAYWGAFFASGKRAYIEKLIAQLPGYDQREDAARFLLAVTAKWSLASNAQREPALRAILEDPARSDPPVTAQQIRELLHEDPELIKVEGAKIFREQHVAGKW